MTTLYHGSDTIIEKPLVNVGSKELDFGPGFYTTKVMEQAERWARRICVIRRSKTPLISTYTFRDEALPTNVRHKCLPEYNEEWLEFVSASRRGETPWQDYDIIEGGVANDQVIDTIEDYFSGRITAEQALGQLRFVKPTHQLCINNQSIIDSYLSFENAVLI